MGKKSRIEIKSDTAVLRPGSPPGEMLRSDFAPVYRLFAFQIDGMKRKTELAADQRPELVYILSEFVRRAGLARIVAGCEYSASGCPGAFFIAADIVALPALNRYRNLT